MELRVASLERTLVDVLDRPDLAGSWEEVWRSWSQSKGSTPCFTWDDPTTEKACMSMTYRLSWNLVNHGMVEQESTVKGQVVGVRPHLVVQL